MKQVAILGASGGIGAAMLECVAAREDVDTVHATYFQSPAASSLGNISTVGTGCGVHWSKVDATQESDIEAWVRSLGRIDWLINCVGMLHTAEQGPEKNISAFSVQHFNNSVATNCLPTLVLAKHARPILKDSPKGVFATVSARVGSISDNRLGGWYSYRTSKAALNMALKCLSIEWARNTRNVRVAALHPGTTDTRLSKPFQKNVPVGKLFSTQKSASLLVKQIDDLHNYPSGRFIAYDGEEIPW